MTDNTKVALGAIILEALIILSTVLITLRVVGSITGWWGRFFMGLVPAVTLVALVFVVVAMIIVAKQN